MSPTPSTRTPIKIARGSYSDLNGSISDLQEGEIVFAQDQDACYVKEGSSLVNVKGMSSTGGNFTGEITQTVTAVSALDIDCSTSNYFTKAISANSTFTFSNIPSSGKAFGFVLEVDVTGSSTSITWPASVKWPAGSAPSLTDAKTHIFTFVTVDNGSCWRGSSLVDYTT
jgi:hypothetical protein